MKVYIFLSLFGEINGLMIDFETELKISMETACSETIRNTSGQDYKNFEQKIVKNFKNPIDVFLNSKSMKIGKNQHDFICF
jgi:hypothetical protein